MHIMSDVLHQVECEAAPRPWALVSFAHNVQAPSSVSLISTHYILMYSEIRCVYASRNVHTENQSHPLYRVFVVSYRHQYINICVRK